MGVILEMRILKGLGERDGEGTLAGLHVGRFEDSEGSRRRSGRRANGVGGFEKIAGLKACRYRGEKES
jgi:hypothetical protein